ncbi:unnamed protein product [marine sediment metagenome]|uniref:Glycosyl transferase family 1 domain-containing protein n=1 Tax=marine sediment metagenome TaxID=412755 RepID=X1IMZ0_9ZZZZ
MNVPVLSNKNSGLSEILNNDNTILVDSGNLEHYCVELNRFLKCQNVEQVERQVDNAREFVEKNFNYDAVMKKYNNIYDKYVKLTEEKKWGY